MKHGIAFVASLLLAAPAVSHAADTLTSSQREQVKEILEDSGVRGGLIVHLGCGDGMRTAAFAKDGYIVQGLETDEKQVDSASQFFASLGADGRVTAAWFDGGDSNPHR